MLLVAYKILSKAIQNRVEPIADPQIGEYLARFWKNCSCSEEIFLLKRIIKIRSLQYILLILSFVDLKKTYYLIKQSTILDILKEMGVYEKAHCSIKQTFTKTYR